MEFIGITLTEWSAILVTLTIAVFTAIMFILGRKRVHYVFGLAALAVTIWIGGFYGAVVSNVLETALFWWKISYVGVILLPFAFLHFIFEFIGVAQLKKFTIALLYAAASVFIILNLSTNFIVDHVKFLFDELYYGQPGLLHPYFFVLYVVLVAYAFYLVLKEYRKRKDDKLFRQRVIYLLIGNFIAFTGGSLNFLPIYEIEVPPVTNISVAFGVALLTYAILRYRLLDARVVTAQLLTLVLAGFTLFRLIVSASAQEMTLNALLLVVTLFVGVYLILSVRKEVEQREQLEVLTKELQAANARLKELDDLKTDFISIASHQLRTPLTAIKGYASMIMEGVYGDAPLTVRGVVDKIFQSAQRLIFIVNDLLDVSRIEQGRMQLAFEEVKALNVLKDVVEELKQTADKKGLRFELSASVDDAELKVKADYSKLRQVFTNLIDNSLKYTPSGFVKVSLERKKDAVVMSVKDSGIGLSEETMQKLFQKFSRARGATRLRADGSGLGLYIVKEIIKAHGGEAWAESAGEGKGSQFYVSLPIHNPAAEAAQQFVEGV